MTTPAVGHMPFKGHRTVTEMWEDEARNSIKRAPRMVGQAKAWRT